MRLMWAIALTMPQSVKATVPRGGRKVNEKKRREKEEAWHRRAKRWRLGATHYD